MQIKTQLTLLFTIITATLLLGFAAVVYYSAKQNREKEFYALLKKEAITKANLFLNARVDAKTLQNIYRNNRRILNEVQVAIYNKDFQLLYHDDVRLDVVKETPKMVREIYQKGDIEFYQKKWQVIGLRYVFNHHNYIITATSYDKYGYIKVNKILKIILLSFIISIVLLYIAGRFYSKRTLNPITEMTKRAKEISIRRLDLRLNNRGDKDEFSELAHTFNEMLNRLEKSFDAQKQFVFNISHELRTPLAAIIAELELSTHKNRTSDEYKNAIHNALGDAKKLVRLSNSLLDLAKASYDPSEIAFKKLRIDEVLLDARQQVQKANAHYKIDIHFDNDFENEDEITVQGNEYLLKTAFVNLLENGCKFSKKAQSMVSISFHQPNIVLKFEDSGIGISPKDLKNIFTPFYRGDNEKFAEGNGIGLSLTEKIILLHKGNIHVNSKVNEGTMFTIKLPNHPF